MSGKLQPTEEAFVKSNNWCRLTVCLNNPVKKALTRILHNDINDPSINGLPSDPSQLYTFLLSKNNKLRNSRVLKQDQLDQLLPQEGKVFSDVLDITLLRFLIQTFSRISNEDGHFREPRHDDHSIAAAVYRAVIIRNKVFHHPNPTSMDDKEFDDIWCQIEKTLSELFFLDDISDYKEQTFDPILVERFHSNMANDFENILLAYKEKRENKAELKDFVQREYKDIANNKITTDIDIDKLFNNHDSVMITAEAGLGKTFSAKHLRYLWASDKILTINKLLYIDSKKVNKKSYKPSFAAPICVSELGDVLKDKTDEYLESFGCVKKTIKDLIAVIDGVDELSIGENVDLDFLKKLQVKIDKNDEISAMETIIGIYFGFFFPGSKIIVFGRKNEVERLKGIQDQLQQSTLFDKQSRIELELQALNEDGVIELISRFTCSKTCCGCEKCIKTYNLVKDFEFRNFPSHLMSLMKIFKYLPNPNFGRITKTKIFIITIFNLLKNHTPIGNLSDVMTFKKLLAFDKTNKFRKCIQNIAKISYGSLLNRNVTIKVETYKENGDDFFKYEETVDGNLEDCVIIERDILEQLDFFYFRDLEYHVILEPYHLTNMEFLASCYIYCHPDKWDFLTSLNADRQTIILSYVAGLHSNENFTKDFLSEVLQYSSIQKIENYLSWLFSIEDVRRYLPKSSWYGLKESGQLFPSFDLLHRINEEEDVFDKISKRLKEEVQTLICYSGHDLEWYEMNAFKHTFLTNNKDEYNINSFLTTFKKFKIIVKDDEVKITNDKQFKIFFETARNDRVESRINRLIFNFAIPQTSTIAEQLKCNSLKIGVQYDSSTIDILFKALSSPSKNTSSHTQPTIQCKRLDIEGFNDQQNKKSFKLCLSDLVDYITLDESILSQDELNILKNLERKTKKLVSIELSYVEFDDILAFPNVDKRHVSLSFVDNVTNNNLIEFRKHIRPGHFYNLSKYKIINIDIPFVRKDDHLRDCEQSMLLNLYGVDLKQVSPEVFANTFSLLPSFACIDDDDDIPSSHWSSLSQIEDCHINELRIWSPRKKNFKHFLGIKTNILQLICNEKNSLEILLNYIASDPNIELDKEIKIFSVIYDKYDWDNYVEITLLRKTINEYKNSYNFRDLDIDRPPFHEGERYGEMLCCEVSLPGDKLNANHITDETDKEDNKNENPNGSSRNLLRKCCCMAYYIHLSLPWLLLFLKVMKTHHATN